MSSGQTESYNPDDIRKEIAIDQGVGTYGDLYPVNRSGSPTPPPKNRPKYLDVAYASRNGVIPSDSGLDEYYRLEPPKSGAEQERQIKINADGAGRARAALRAVRNGEDFDFPDLDGASTPDDEPIQPELPLE